MAWDGAIFQLASKHVMTSVWYVACSPRLNALSVLNPWQTDMNIKGNSMGKCRWDCFILSFSVPITCWVMKCWKRVHWRLGMWAFFSCLAILLALHYPSPARRSLTAFTSSNPHYFSCMSFNSTFPCPTFRSTYFFSAIGRLLSFYVLIFGYWKTYGLLSSINLTNSMPCDLCSNYLISSLSFHLWRFEKEERRRQRRKRLSDGRGDESLHASRPRSADC